LSLLRYGGFACMPEAAALRQRLQAEQGEYLHHGIHLIVVQAADRTLVVGDSHHYDTADQPFSDAGVDALILEEYRSATGRAAPAVRERWLGTYAVAASQAVLIDSPATAVRLVVVTSGIGASTGFAIGEEVIEDLFK